MQVHDKASDGRNNNYYLTAAIPQTRKTFHAVVLEAVARKRFSDRVEAQNSKIVSTSGGQAPQTPFSRMCVFRSRTHSRPLGVGHIYLLGAEHNRQKKN